MQWFSANQRTLIMLSGPACSGKSTLISTELVPALVKLWPANISLEILSTDDIINRRAAKAGKTYNEIFNDIDHKQIKQAMYEQLQHAQRSDRNIIWDQTNCSGGNRVKKLKWARLTEYYRIVVFFTITFETLMARNVRPGKIIPESVLRTMYDSYDQNTTGFDAAVYMGEAGQYREVIYNAANR